MVLSGGNTKMSIMIPESGDTLPQLLGGETISPTKELVESLANIAALAGGVAVVEAWHAGNKFYGDDKARTIGTLIPGQAPETVSASQAYLYEGSFTVRPDASRPGDRDSQGVTGNRAAPRSVPLGDDHLLRFLRIVDAENNTLEPSSLY